MMHGGIIDHVPRPLYAFWESYDFSHPDQSGVSVPQSGDGLDIELLAKQTVKSNILPNEPFETIYEGFLEVAITNASFMEFEMRFFHKFGAQEFWASRNAEYRVSNNSVLTIPLNIYNSISQVPLGTYTTRDGTSITVTEADLRGDIELQILLRVTSLNRGTRARRANTIDIQEQLGKVHFRQLHPVL